MDGSKSMHHKSKWNRELQSQTKEVRESLKEHGPSDREVEFARQSLRRTVMGIIFHGDDSGKASRSKILGVLTVLWFESTHAFIHAYRQRISALDEEIARIKSNPQSRTTARSGPPPPGPTARRKLVQAFRAFLAAEESFWSGLLARIVYVYEIEKARFALSALNISAYEPDEDDPKLSLPSKSAVEICHKVLIFYGDLARYRELYSESSGSGKERRQGRAKTNGQEHHGQHWARANEAYNQARVLLPESGNPANQLAVLAQYQQDTLSSVYWYYRAITSVQPFTSARSNLETFLSRAYDKYLLPTESHENKQAALKHHFISLNAMILLEKDLEDVPKQLDTVINLFSQSIADRALQSEMILKIVVTAISAWWTVRVHRASKNDVSQTDFLASGNVRRDSICEASALDQVIQILSALFYSPCLEPVSVNTDSTDLGQTVSAVLRRCLPAIRVSLQWIVRNLERLSHTDSESLRDLWKNFANLINKLVSSFPLNKLTVYQRGGEVILEENIDVRGFAPLRANLKEDMKPAIDRTQIHPNEEQLLRIGDIMNTASLIAGSVGSSLSFDGSKFTVVLEEPPSNTLNLPEELGIESEGQSMDMDPVDMAMRAAAQGITEDDDLDDDDQVLYPTAGLQPQEQVQTRQPQEMDHGATASDVLLNLLRRDTQGGDQFIQNPRQELPQTTSTSPSIWAQQTSEWHPNSTSPFAPPGISKEPATTMPMSNASPPPLVNAPTSRQPTLYSFSSAINRPNLQEQQHIPSRELTPMNEQSLAQLVDYMSPFGSPFTSASPASGPMSSFSYSHNFQPR